MAMGGKRESERGLLAAEPRNETNPRRKLEEETTSGSKLEYFLRKRRSILIAIKGKNFPVHIWKKNKSMKDAKSFFEAEERM